MSKFLKININLINIVVKYLLPDKNYLIEIKKILLSELEEITKFLKSSIELNFNSKDKVKLSKFYYKQYLKKWYWEFGYTFTI
jgi:hypothetical protein